MASQLVRYNVGKTRNMKLFGRQSTREKQYFNIGIVESSPLRNADPRTKVFLCMLISLAVMLPIYRLVGFMVVYACVMVWARLGHESVSQVWRLRFLLLVLFLLDLWLVNLELAVTVSLRIVLLTGVFALFFSTTTPRELALGLEALRFPYRFAFSISLAVSSLNLIGEEWQAIQEAQTVRGVTLSFQGVKGLTQKFKQFVAFTVPAIVLVTKRAWNSTEAAYARGFDSPNRRSYQPLKFGVIDLVILLVSLGGMAGLFFYP